MRGEKIGCADSIPFSYLLQSDEGRTALFTRRFCGETLASDAENGRDQCLFREREDLRQLVDEIPFVVLHLENRLKTIIETTETKKLLLHETFGLMTLFDASRHALRTP